MARISDEFHEVMLELEEKLNKSLCVPSNILKGEQVEPIESCFDILDL